MRPDQPGTQSEPAQPATNRVRRHPQPRSDPPIPLPSDARLDRRPDHRHLVLAAQQRHLRQQHVRARAPPTPPPPRPQQPIPRRAAQHPLPSMTPRPQRPPPRRTTNKPADQLTLDARLLGAYDQHRVPPPASKRALPTTSNPTGGLSRVQKRAKPANPTNPSPPSTARAPPRVLNSNVAQHP